MTIIQLENLKKSFGTKQVLRGVTIEVREGEKLVIIGRSGCGKSVLLKHIVRLLKPDSGRVTVYGQEMGTLRDSALFDIRKRFGYLFQGAALFDSMTVGENVALPLVENYRFTEDEIREKVAEKLEMVGLPGIEKLKPSELSGGMKKRVGLARAIVTDPDVILYDEPTTGLDPVMSDAIDSLINDLASRLKVTSIVITHDMASVQKVADRVIMIHDGLVHFEGTPDRLFESNDPVVQHFVSRVSADDQDILHEMADLTQKGRSEKRPDSMTSIKKK